MQLVVEAAQGPPDGRRIIVLHKQVGNAGLCISPLVLALEEQSSRVAVHVRFNQQGAWNLQGCHAHGRPFFDGLVWIGPWPMAGVDDVRIVGVQLPQSFDQRFGCRRTVTGGLADRVVPCHNPNAGAGEE